MIYDKKIKKKKIAEEIFFLLASALGEQPSQSSSKQSSSANECLILNKQHQTIYKKISVGCGSELLQWHKGAKISSQPST